jgi:hypothetical protein
MAEWSGANRPATAGGRYVMGAPAMPGAMELPGPRRSAGPGTNANRSCDSFVRFAATSQPLTTILDTGQGCLDRHEQCAGVVAGGRIRYHRVLDFVGAGRATNTILCPTAIYVNHTSLLKR